MSNNIDLQNFMKKCKNCSKQKIRRTYRLSHSPNYQIINEYGMSKIASSPKILICNDQYMLELLFKNEKKTKKLEKQVHKMKHQIRKIQHSLQHTPYYSRNQRMSHVEKVQLADKDSQKNQQKDRSRRSSISSSKNRQIGRFTRVSEGDSQSFSKNSLKQFTPTSFKVTQKCPHQKLFPCTKNNNSQRSETVSFSKKSSTYLQNTFRPKPQTDQLLIDQKEPINENFKNLKNYNSNAQSIPQKDINEQIDFDMYLPSYRKVENSESSNLLQPNDDGSEILSQKARLQREFEELIIMEKTANIKDQKNIRQQIKNLSQMLQNLQD